MKLDQLRVKCLHNLGRPLPSLFQSENTIHRGLLVYCPPQWDLLLMLYLLSASTTMTILLYKQTHVTWQLLKTKFSWSSLFVLLRMADSGTAAVAPEVSIAAPTGTTVATPGSAGTECKASSHSNCTQTADPSSSGREDKAEDKGDPKGGDAKGDETATTEKDEENGDKKGDEEQGEEDRAWRTVCISNLSDSLKSEHLGGLFKTCGEIELCTIRLKFGAGRVCYIRFHSEEAAQTALLLNGQPLDGKSMTITLVDGSNLPKAPLSGSGSNTDGLSNSTSNLPLGLQSGAYDPAAINALNGSGGHSAVNALSETMTQSNALQTVQLMANPKMVRSLWFQSHSIYSIPFPLCLSRKIASKFHTKSHSKSHYKSLCLSPCAVPDDHFRFESHSKSHSLSGVQSTGTSTGTDTATDGMTHSSGSGAAGSGASGSSQANGSGTSSSALAAALAAGSSTASPSKEELARQDKLARTIYVGNLNPMIQVDHLKEFFSVCGAVNLVKIAGNSTNPQAARYGFVEFETTEPAHAAYNLSGHFLLDRPIKIGPARNAILNPHPSTKSTPITNPVKINHAMVKVRLLQKRISNRYQSENGQNGSNDGNEEKDGAHGDNDGDNGSNKEDGHHREGRHRRNTSTKRKHSENRWSRSRSRSRSRSKGRRGSRYREDAEYGYSSQSTSRRREYDYDRYRDRRRYRDREMGDRERDRDYDRRRDRLKRKKRRKQEKEERRAKEKADGKAEGKTDGEKGDNTETAKGTQEDEVW